MTYGGYCESAVLSFTFSAEGSMETNIGAIWYRAVVYNRGVQLQEWRVTALTPKGMHLTRYHRTSWRTLSTPWVARTRRQALIDFRRRSVGYVRITYRALLKVQDQLALAYQMGDIPSISVLDNEAGTRILPPGSPVNPEPVYYDNHGVRLLNHELLWGLLPDDPTQGSVQQLLDALTVPDNLPRFGGGS